MKIEIISVTSLDGGAEMLLSFKLTGEDGRCERRKLLVFTDTYLESGFCKGSVLSETEFEELEQTSRACLAIRKGSDLLSYSPSSKVRLSQRLRRKGIDRESADTAVKRLEELGFINEEQDVERAVHGCLKKLWGKKRIYRELCAKGYERNIVEAALAELDEELMVENCVALINKKVRKMPQDAEVQKKIIASIFRYGYSSSEIRRALEIVYDK